MTFFVPYPISTRDSHISLRVKGPQADMGRGLILGIIRKIYHNLFIIYFLLFILLFTESQFYELVADAATCIQICTTKIQLELSEDLTIAPL